MKKQVIKMLRLLIVLMLVLIMPVESFAAAASGSIQLAGESGAQAQAASEDGDTPASRRRVTVKLSSTYAAVDGVTSLQFSLKIEQGTAPAFVFEKSLQEKASITEYRYDSTSGQMNLYISGTKQLFHGNDPLKIGYVTLESAAATVSVVENSLKYVYGTELRSAHENEGGSDQIGSVEHTHIFDGPDEDTWIWTDAPVSQDGSETAAGPECTVKATCLDCGDTVIFDCVVEAERVEPTCAKAGSITYKATVELNTSSTGKKTYTNPDNKTVEIPATGKHSYTYKDNGNGENHEKICQVCGETVTEAHNFDENKICKDCQGEHTHSYKKAEPEFRWSGTEEEPECTGVLKCDTCGKETMVSCKILDPVEKEATCTEPGKLIYTASFYGNDSKLYSSSDYGQDKEVLTGEPAKGHSYGEKAEYQWSEDHKTCTAVLTCTACKETCSKEMQVAANTIAPTCAEDGKIVYTAALTVGGNTYETSETVKDEANPATGKHEYQASYQWSVQSNAKEAYTADCTAVLTCDICGKIVKDLACDVALDEEKSKSSTCTEHGVNVYSAVLEYEGKEYTSTHESELPIAEHVYVYVNDEADLERHTVQCENCDLNFTELHDFADNKCIYCGAQASGDQCKHKYGEPAFAWSGEDGSQCEATFTCGDCKESVTRSCAVTLREEQGATCTENGYKLYQASVEFNGTVYPSSDEKEVTNKVEIKATGHDYSQCSFHWSDDKTAASASLICSNCGEVLVIEEGADNEYYALTVTLSEEKEATCTEEGTRTSTAVVKKKGDDSTEPLFSDKQTMAIPAKGHRFGAPVFSGWSVSDGKPICSAVFTCVNGCADENGNPTEVTETCEIHEETVSAPTCTETGLKRYTAAVVFDGEAYTNPNAYEETIAELGHKFNDNDYVSNNDATCTMDGTKTAFCSNGCGTKNTITDAGSKVDHERQYKDSGDGEHHIVTCKNCDLNINEVHQFDEDGVCVADGCGARAEQEHIHTYGKPVFEWSADYRTVNAVFTCTADDCEKDGMESVTVEGEVDEGEVTAEPTCREEGKKLYTATVTFNGEVYTDTKTEALATVDHSYTNYVDDNNATCAKNGTATAACDYGCGTTHTIELENTKTDDHTYTGFACSEDGLHHISNCDVCGEELSEGNPLYHHQYDESGICIYCGARKAPEHTCTYGEPEFIWDEDFNCRAVFTCTDETCSAVQEVTCTVVRETTPAACEEEGELAFIATAEWEGETYTDTRTIILAPTGHSFVYSGEKSDDTHTLKCENCDAVKEEPHTYTDGVCSICGAKEPSDHEHTYEEPVFTWSENYKSCEAAFICKDGDDQQIVACEVTSETTAATCEKDGETVYTAAVVFGGKTYTDIQTVAIPTSGHVYGEPVFNWTDGNDSCTATFTCANCGDVQTVNCTVTSETTEATSKKDGKIVYTAKVQFNGQIYTDTKTTVIPAKDSVDSGFSFGSAIKNWFNKWFGKDDEPSEPETEAETEPETPEETETPSEPETPEETEKPSEAETPEETEKPSEEETPEETEKPSEEETPEETEKPDDSGDSVWNILDWIFGWWKK